MRVSGSRRNCCGGRFEIGLGHYTSLFPHASSITRLRHSRSCFLTPLRQKKYRSRGVYQIHVPFNAFLTIAFRRPVKVKASSSLSYTSELIDCCCSSVNNVQLKWFDNTTATADFQFSLPFCVVISLLHSSSLPYYIYVYNILLLL